MSSKIFYKRLELFLSLCFLS